MVPIIINYSECNRIWIRKKQSAYTMFLLETFLDFLGPIDRIISLQVSHLTMDQKNCIKPLMTG